MIDITTREEMRNIRCDLSVTIGNVMRYSGEHGKMRYTVGFDWYQLAASNYLVSYAPFAIEGH